MILLGVVKTLQVTVLWRISLVSYYIFGIGATIFVGHYMNLGVRGMWVGWIIGTFISLVFMLKYLLQIDWKKSFSIVRDKFKTIE